MQSFVQDRYFREHVRGENPRVTAWFFHAYVSHITAPARAAGGQSAGRFLG